MIPIANNLEEAIKHFLNSNGLIACYKGENSIHASTLKEANDFYNKTHQPKKVRNKVRPIKK